MKHPLKFNVRQLTLLDSGLFTEARELLCRTQGANIFKPGYLEKCSIEKDILLLGAFSEAKLIGIAVARVLGPERTSVYAQFGEKVLNTLQTKRTGMLETASVLECFQGHGVGRKLTQERMVWLESQGCVSVAGISWVSGLAHTSERVYLKLGFECIAESTEFYPAISLKFDFSCPVCGPPPCKCLAKFYLKRLDAQ